MDKDLNRWIVEFLLRQPIPVDLIRKAISLLPLPNRDSRFKKTLLLRSIQGSAISYDVLETLELVEELDRLEGVAVTNSMQVAYCAVAVCCTLDCVGDGEGEDMAGEYFAAVRRIWRSKVDKMEGKSGLFSNELGNWRDEIEAAVVDDDARRTLFMKKSTAADHALRSVKSYLEEAWEIMGPSFLESAAKVMQGSSTWSEHADRERDLIRDSGDNDGDRIELGANQDVGERASSLHDSGQDPGGDGSDRVEVAPQLMNQQVHGVGDQQVAADMVKGDASLHESSQDLGGNKDDRLELAAKAINPGQVQGLGNKEVGDTVGNTVVKFHRKKHAARRRCISRRAQIVDIEDSDSDMSCTGNDPLSSPEVRQVQEALKSSNMELRAMVKDPLPDALKVSEIVRCELQKKHMNDGPSIQNQNGADVVEEPIPDIERNVEPVQAEEANVINQKNSVRPSWMERNSTARTYEWDDSIDSDSTEGSSKGRKRIHLPTPDRIVCSPLKNVNAAAKRRKKKKWSVVEEDTLRTGVHLYGRGNWKAIMASYPGIFEERTCVDLKDKWRNMEK